MCEHRLTGHTYLAAGTLLRLTPCCSRHDVRERAHHRTNIPYWYQYAVLQHRSKTNARHSYKAPEGPTRWVAYSTELVLVQMY